MLLGNGGKQSKKIGRQRGKSKERKS